MVNTHISYSLSIRTERDKIPPSSYWSRHLYLMTLRSIYVKKNYRAYNGEASFYSSYSHFHFQTQRVNNKRNSANLYYCLIVMSILQDLKTTREEEGRSVSRGGVQVVCAGGSGKATHHIHI